MSLRLLPIAAALLLWSAPVRGAISSQRLTWEELPQLIGKYVDVPLYNGGAVAGRVREVQADALVIEVSKTTSVTAYPKGLLRVPRATLNVLNVHGKGIKYRILGTTLGFVAGTAGGAGVAIGVQGGLFSNDHGSASAAAFVGVMGGVTAAGYLLGNAADRRTTTIQIVH